MLAVFNAVLICLCLSYIAWYLGKRKRRSGEPPLLDSFIPWLGLGVQYQKDPVKFLWQQQKEHGPIFTVPMGGSYFTFVVDPLLHPAVAKESKKLSFREYTIPMVKKIFDFTRRSTAVSTAGGVLPKYLQGAKLDELSDIMMVNLQDVIFNELVIDQKTVDMSLLQLSHVLMFTAGFYALFGTSVEKESAEIKTKKMYNIIKDFQQFDKAFPFIAKGLPVWSMKGFSDIRKRFWKMFTDESMSERENIFPLMIALTSLSEEEEQDLHRLPRERFSIFFASQSNTVLSVFWAIYYILKCPQAREKIIEEINNVLGEQDLKDSLKQKSYLNVTRSQLNRMTILESAINESLRLTVSASMLRQCTDDYKLQSSSQEFKLRQGDKVMVLFQATHLNPKIYEDPLKYKYDRFLNDDGTLKTKFNMDGKPVKYHFQPFGSGLSKCPGRYWAMAEIKQVVLLLLHYFDMDLLNKQEEIKCDLGKTGFGTLPPIVDPIVRIQRK